VKEDEEKLNPAGIVSYESLSSPLYPQSDTDTTSELLHIFNGATIELYSDYRRPEETLENLTKRLPNSLLTRDSLVQRKDVRAGYNGTSYTNTVQLQGVGSAFQQGFWFLTKINNYDIVIDIRLTISNDKVIDKETKNSYRDVYDRFLTTFKLITDIQEFDITN